MKFILDLSKWRCGDKSSTAPSEWSLGLGGTCLLNNEGYMCCLGQFSLQTNSVTADDIMELSDPYGVKRDIPFLVYEYRMVGLDWANTELSSNAIGINDDPDTTIRQKIDALTNLFKEHGHEIEIYNPTNIQY